jgi:hypothetical protein
LTCRFSSPKTPDFDVTFPLFAKTDVNGSDADVYKFLKREARGIFGTERIKWNFTKFLVDSLLNPQALRMPSRSLRVGSDSALRTALLL